MKRVLAHYPKILLAVLFGLALVAVTAAVRNPQGGDKGFAVEGKKLIIKKDFIHEKRPDGSVTVRRRGAATTTGTLVCKCQTTTKGCVVTKGEDTPDGGKVEYCGGNSCCDWR